MNNTLIEMMNKDMEVAKNVIALKINIDIMKKLQERYTIDQIANTEEGQNTMNNIVTARDFLESKGLYEGLYM